MKKLALPLLALLVASPLIAQDEQAPFMVEESGRSYWRLDEAVQSIGNGQGTITIAPGSYDQCAVQSEGAITYRAAQPGSVVFDGVACEGKGTFVLRGQAARVEGIIFQNIRVGDRNGVGLRLEKGNLDVENCIFRNSEQGILAGVDKSAKINVSRSTFSGLGGCPDGMCSHSIYIGDFASLTVTRSRFERGTGGHYVKTRTPKVLIEGNSFDDTQGRETNYMIDLAAGAVGTISSNVFVQGRNKENFSAMITVAPENRNNRSAGLVITGNKATLAPGAKATTFIVDWSKEPLRIGPNQLGAGITVKGSA